MTKEIMRDILTDSQRTIRRIGLPPRREISRLERPPAKPAGENGRWKKLRIRLYLLAAGGLAVAGLLFIFISRGRAEVVVQPNRQSLELSEVFSAGKTTAGGQRIATQFIVAEQTAEKQLPATGEAQVERRASGEIIIYNKHSGNPQTLIKNTRFETAQGLIYRIQESVTVPGATFAGEETVPGQLKVTVYADFPGEEYNIGLSDFTVPGFKGLPQYQNFYGRSVTPMTGGFSGRQKIVESIVLAAAQKELADGLKEKLTTQLKAKIPDGFIMFPETFKIELTELPPVEDKETVAVKQQGRAVALVFSQGDLEKQIGQRTGQSADPVSVQNLENLKFSSQDLPLDWQAAEQFEFKLTGPIQVVWQIDREKIRNDLAGQNRQRFKEILAKYPAVAEAEMTLKPSWRRTFPQNPRRIEIKLIDIL